ncbi:MAG: DUF4032 domain-containing protein [Candidatus Dormibacter sp.]|uniref:DUF4032 domain-containing protein n=1 Tax=Candidatus Dormibacter sp. TaxID=2973982 RepID=UPI000DB2920E|nr:MAG: DUF4032 domain-containing protein [Candidatus Dormibacteraeota bacterium]
MSDESDKLAAESYSVIIRPEWSGLIGLDWARPLLGWQDDRIVDLPRGISRHEVRFLALHGATFALKELPGGLATREYHALRRLEELGGSAVRAAGLVLRRLLDPGSEQSGVVITRYVDYSFSYRELLSGESFGPRRDQLLDAFAFLLVELHLLGCFWGDCSLSNVLYRYDAGAIETLLVDAETTALHPSLSDGQRQHDLSIMIDNVGGEMGDIAAVQGVSLDSADLGLGDDIARRYERLWTELGSEQRIPVDRQYLITERIAKLNDLGFQVDQLEVIPHPGRDHLHLRLKVGDRNFHSSRLRELTGVEAAENQARQILADLRYFEVKEGRGESAKPLLRMRWRVEEFEPWLRRLARHLPPEADPLQAYCDLLHHRYLLSAEAGRDVGTEAAFQHWLSSDRPGYPLAAEGLDG